MSNANSGQIDEIVRAYLDEAIERRRFLGWMLCFGVTVVGGSLFSLAGCASTPVAQPSPTGTATPKTATPEASKPTPDYTSKPDGEMKTSPLSVPEGDPAVEPSTVTFSNEGATIMTYQAKPIGNGPFPALLICHENRGLTDHIRDVARRFAKEGYVALALDLLSREGGTANIADQAQISGMLSSIPQERHVSDFQAGYRYLEDQPFVNRDRIGMIGYCFGGGVTWRSVTRISGLKAAVPYYGPNPPLEDVPNIQAAVFGVYAENDPRINVGREPLEEALNQHNKTYQMKTYPGVRHAFFNDTGTNYNEEQSLIVWKDTLDWFSRYLKS